MKSIELRKSHFRAESFDHVKRNRDGCRSAKRYAYVKKTDQENKKIFNKLVSVKPTICFDKLQKWE